MHKVYVNNLAQFMYQIRMFIKNVVKNSGFFNVLTFSGICYCDQSQRA